MHRDRMRNNHSTLLELKWASPGIRESVGTYYARLTNPNCEKLEAIAKPVLVLNLRGHHVAVAHHVCRPLLRPLPSRYLSSAVAPFSSPLSILPSFSIFISASAFLSLFSSLVVFFKHYPTMAAIQDAKHDPTIISSAEQPKSDISVDAEKDLDDDDSFNIPEKYRGTAADKKEMSMLGKKQVLRVCIYSNEK